MISLPQIIFCYFAAAILTLSGMAVTLRNPVHCVLLVLLMFFHMAGIYLTLNAEFLAAVQIIVYAGAILVLYLFVVFLVNLKTDARTPRLNTSRPIGGVIALLLFALLLYGIPSFKLGTPGKWSMAALREVGNTKALGIELFTTYLLPFEITGIILLVAVVGGIVLARRDSEIIDTTNNNTSQQEPEEAQG